MTFEEWFETVKQDVERRNLSFQSFVLVDQQLGKLQYISYDDNGAASFISEKTDDIKMYKSNNNGTISEIAAISINK